MMPNGLFPEKVCIGLTHFELSKLIRFLEETEVSRKNSVSITFDKH